MTTKEDAVRQGGPLKVSLAERLVYKESQKTNKPKGQ